MEASPVIIPIAAGKGGVGKSFLAANLAIALAQLGHPTIAVDLDLGGSNLHSFLGLHNRHPGIGDYLQARVGPLEELLVPTDLDNLTFLPGDGRTPFMANIPHAQKLKLISHIKKLPAEYILLDLGAGSTYNTLDFFSMSEKGIVITTPEPPAIMNMLVFLKNHLLRCISKTLQDQGFQEFLKEHNRRPMESQMPSIQSLRDEIAREDPAAAGKIGEVLETCRPRIVFNLGEHPDELQVTSQINKSLDTVLSVSADYFGFIFYDPAVRQSVREQKALMLSQPDSQAAESVLRIARRIEKYWDVALEDTVARLEKYVQAAYSKMSG